MNVKIQKATPESFGRFGKVVSAPTAAPTAEAEEFKFWSDIAHYQIQGETEIGLCTVYAQPKMAVSGVERHLQTPEILIPIDAPFVLPVLLEGDSEENLVAFKVDLGEAAVINEGVWHGACLPVGKAESTYFVIFRRGTPHEDVAKKNVDTLELSF